MDGVSLGSPGEGQAQGTKKQEALQPCPEGHTPEGVLVTGAAEGPPEPESGRAP